MTFLCGKSFQGWIKAKNDCLKNERTKAAGVCPACKAAGHGKEKNRNRLYTDCMQTFILDASKIDPQKDAAQFFSDFYSLPLQPLTRMRNELYTDPVIRVTEVFKWPATQENWKEIASTLELIQQHSPSFYVIWGPETTDAIAYDQKLLEEEKSKKVPKKSDSGQKKEKAAA